MSPVPVSPVAEGEPYWSDESVTLHLGDCLAVLRTMEAGSVDAIVTDPPYGLEFMGKEWDTFGRDTGNGYREKPRMTGDHMGKGFKELPNHFEAGRPFQRWCELWACECLRVLKPGGHMLAFGGTPPQADPAGDVRHGGRLLTPTFSRSGSRPGTGRRASADRRDLAGVTS